MLTKVKWKNHEILGNLELDFIKPDGKPYTKVVIVGENGSGKSTVLSTLATFLNLGSITSFDFIECEIDGDRYRLSGYNSNSNLGFHKRTKLSDDSSKQINTNRDNNFESIDKDNEDIRRYGIIYSTARSDFKTDKIKSSSTLQLDKDKYEVDNKENFTSIKQLLIDLNEQDNSQWMKITKEKISISFDEFLKTSKLSRFRSAFNGFFEHIEFDGVDEESTDEKKIIFKKFNQDISIDNLSTGEKQIVFRGAQILRNKNVLIGGEIFVDEPELSMHPQWQSKIFEFYGKLIEGTETQLIMASHSEYVLKSAIVDSNTLIISLVNNNGVIEQKRIDVDKTLPTLTFAEIRYLVLNVISVDYHIELYGYLQQLNGKTHIKDCDDYIKQQPEYNDSIHKRISHRGEESLPTYIRNAIDHPDSGRIYNEQDLKESINILIKMCRRLSGGSKTSI